MSNFFETPDRTRNSKRALSSPDNELINDLKRPNYFPANMESPITPLPGETTLTLSEDAIQKISDTLVATFRTHIESIVENVVSSVMSKFNSKLEALEQANTLLITENSDLKANISRLESKLDDQEQYSRRNLVRVSGIQENQSENTDDLIIKLSDAIGSGLSLTEIDRSHRVGKPNPSKPRDIIVKFTSYRARQKVYLKRSKLKDVGYNKTFINEDLTAKRSSLLFNARALVKSGRLLGAWSSDGTILIKDSKSKTHRVNNNDYLNSFRSDDSNR